MEMQAYRLHIDEGKVELIRLASLIAQTRALLAQLEEEKEAIQKDVDDLRIIAHPLRSQIPIDIFTEIFCTCRNMVLDALRPQDKMSSLDPKQAPWTLSQVSKHWRDVAVGFPILWADISVVISQSDRDEKSLRRISYFLNAQLQRASWSPLSVTLVCRGSLDHFVHVLQPLLSCSTRWKTLGTHLELASHLILNQIEGSLPCLTSAEVTLYKPSRVEVPTITLNFLKFCPNLRRLFLPSFAIGSFTGDWRQVKRFVGLESMNEFHLSALRRFPSLDTCWLISSGDPSPIPRSPLVIPSVSSMSLVSRDESLWLLLSWIELPALRSLSLTVTQPLSDPLLIERPLKRIFESCNFQLHTLEVMGDFALTTQFSNALSPLLSLSTLEVRTNAPSPQSKSDWEIFNLLMKGRSSAWLPNLRVVTVNSKAWKLIPVEGGS
jgi:hypothetical protein